MQTNQIQTSEETLAAMYLFALASPCWQVE